MKCFHTLALLAAMALAGCGGPRDVSVPVETRQTDAQRVLEDIAETGQVGSRSMELREGLEQLSQTDPGKADALLRELDELEAMSGESQIRAKANAMLQKL